MMDAKWFVTAAWPDAYITYVMHDDRRVYHVWDKTPSPIDRPVLLGFGLTEDDAWRNARQTRSVMLQHRDDFPAQDSNGGTVHLFVFLALRLDRSLRQEGGRVYGKYIAAYTAELVPCRQIGDTSDPKRMTYVFSASGAEDGFGEICRTVRYGGVDDEAMRIAHDYHDRWDLLCPRCMKAVHEGRVIARAFTRRLFR